MLEVNIALHNIGGAVGPLCAMLEIISGTKSVIFYLDLQDYPVPQISRWR